MQTFWPSIGTKKVFDKQIFFLRKNKFLAYYLLISHSVFSQQFELPKTRRDETIVFHTGHILSFNQEWMQPEWVAYELTSMELTGPADRKNSTFLRDPVLPVEWQPSPRDYTGSGYSRGHLIPAGDLKYSQKAMDDSFLMSNICPMFTEFNTGIWERLERKVRAWAKQFGRVYIICGPVMGRNVNGKVGMSSLPVPDAFYKAVLIPYGDSYVSISFYMPNSPEPKKKLGDYAISTFALESLIGRKLFYDLDRKTAKRAKEALPLKELGLQ